MKLTPILNRLMREIRLTAAVVAGQLIHGMRVIRRVVGGPGGHKVLHFVLRYRILAFAGGLTLMYGAACLGECCPHGWSERTWECYFVWPLHATGLIPLLKPLEAVWAMLTIDGENEVAAVAVEAAKETVGV